MIIRLSTTLTYNKTLINSIYTRTIPFKLFSRNTLKMSNHLNHQNQTNTFSKQQSKYLYNPDLSQQDIQNKQEEIPKYLIHKSNKESSVKLKAGKRMPIFKKPFQRKPTKSVILKERHLRREIDFRQRTFPLLSQDEKKLLQHNTDLSIDRHYREFIGLEKQRIKQNLQAEISKQRSIKYFPLESLAEANEERLSKRLSSLGVCSRREAEKLILKGLIKVDGQVVNHNVPVTVNSNIQLYRNKGYTIPIKQSIKVWAFYKPSGMVCYRKDLRVIKQLTNRTVLQYTSI